jgi:DNA-directed RNA polymerase subunit RPC12/RpoP
MNKSYKCGGCGNDTFKLQDRKVKYLRDTRIEPVLVCGKCGKKFNIDPCNTNGLIDPD